MNLYPVQLALSGKRCIIVGGGAVAERKADGLLACGASVVIVARDMTDRLRSWAAEGHIEMHRESYRRDHLQGAFFVIGATDDEDVNDAVFRDASSLDIPVNVVDDPEKCTVIIPAVVRRGDLTIGVSTNGKSPALARRLRIELEGRYGQEYETVLHIMGRVRTIIRERGRASQKNKEIFEALLDGGIVDAVREKRWDDVRGLVYEITGETITIGEE